MPKLTLPMPSFEGVSAGATAVCRLEIGRTFEQLHLTYSGVTLAQMKELRLVGNGKVIRRWVGASLIDKVNQFDRKEAAAGVLAIDLGRSGLMTVAGRAETFIGTGLRPTKEFPHAITTLNLEVDIDAAAAAPALSCKAYMSAARHLDNVLYLDRFIKNPSGAGEYEISDLPKGKLINRIVFETATNKINGLKVMRDNRVIFERTKAENELIQKNGKRTPQDGLFVYDPTEEGLGSEAMVTYGVHDLRFILDMAAAETVVANVEYIGKMEG